VVTQLKDNLKPRTFTGDKKVLISRKWYKIMT